MDKKNVKNKFLFVSDHSCPKELKDTLTSNGSTLVSFNESFIGKEIKHYSSFMWVWVNISHKTAREWLKSNLLKIKNAGYKIMSTYSGDDDQLWITQVKPDIITSLKKLCGIKDKTLCGIVNALITSDINIAEPVKCCISRLFCKSRIKKKEEK